MKKGNSILIINVYFGKLPWYFELYLFTCSYNKDVDFIILTDQDLISYRLPENVNSLFYQIDDFKSDIYRSLGFEIPDIIGLKLCDYRPAFGLIFDWFIKPYDFWGYSDIDVVYGNIRSFITDTVLKRYDLISVRPEYLTGFFSLYRNTKKVNELFKHSKSFIQLFQNEKYMAFDECSHLCFELMEGKDIMALQSENDSMTHLLKDRQRRVDLEVLFEFFAIEGVPGQLDWENGHLFFKNRFEVMMYHLCWIKNHPRFFMPPNMALQGSGFYITPNEIIQKVLC